MARNFTQDQLDAAAVAATKTDVVAAAGLLGERDTEQAYQNVIEAVAGVLLTDDNAPYDLAVVVARQLRGDCQAVLDEVDTMPDALSRCQLDLPVGADVVAAARAVETAAQQLQRSVATQTTGTQDITRDQNFLRMQRRVAQLLEAARPAITDSRGIAMTPAEARTYLATQVPSVLSAYDDVVETARRLDDLLAATSRATNRMTWRSVHSAAVRARANTSEAVRTIERDPSGSTLRSAVLAAQASVTALRTLGRTALRVVDNTGVVPSAPYWPAALSSEPIGTLVLAAPTTYRFHGATTFDVTVPASPVGSVESVALPSLLTIDTLDAGLLQLSIDGIYRTCQVPIGTYTPHGLAAEMALRIDGATAVAVGDRVVVSRLAGDVTGTLAIYQFGLGARLGFPIGTHGGHRTFAEDFAAEVLAQAPAGTTASVALEDDATVSMVTTPTTADRTVVWLPAGLTAPVLEFRLVGGTDVYHVLEYRPADGQTTITPSLPVGVRDGSVVLVQQRILLGTLDTTTATPWSCTGNPAPWPDATAVARFDTLAVPDTSSWRVGDIARTDARDTRIQGVLAGRAYLAEPLPVGTDVRVLNGWNDAYLDYRADFSTANAGALPDVVRARQVPAVVPLDQPVSRQVVQRLLTLLSAVQAATQAIHDATAGLVAYEPSQAILGCFVSLRRAGLDRSYDRLLHGNIVDTLDATSDQASYAGTTMAAIQAIAVNDLPVRKDTGRATPAQRLISTSASTDYEYSQADTDRSPPPRVPSE